MSEKLLGVSIHEDEEKGTSSWWIDHHEIKRGKTDSYHRRGSVRVEQGELWFQDRVPRIMDDEGFESVIQNTDEMDTASMASTCSSEDIEEHNETITSSKLEPVTSTPKHIFSSRTTSKVSYANQEKSIGTFDIAKYLTLNGSLSGGQGRRRWFSLPRRTFKARFMLWSEPSIPKEHMEVPTAPAACSLASPNNSVPVTCMSHKCHTQSV